jgi:hypothetical protein
MKNVIRLSLLSALFFSSLVSFSQTVVPDKDNEYDKKYTPPQSSIFNNLNKKNKESSGSSDIDFKNSLRFSPTLLFRQKVGFFYEREITDGFSVTFGLGKAFGRDVIEALGMEVFSLEDYTPNTASAGSLLNQSEYYGSSPFVNIGLRLYYSGETFDGGYIDLFYRNEKTTYTIANQIDGYRVEGSRIAEFKMSSFNCGFGFSGASGKNNNITHDFFVSMGIRLYQYTKYDRVEIPAQYSYYSSETIYRATNSTLSARLAPAVNISYALGFGF